MENIEREERIFINFQRLSKEIQAWRHFIAILFQSQPVRAVVANVLRSYPKRWSASARFGLKHFVAGVKSYSRDSKFFKPDKPCKGRVILYSLSMILAMGALVFIIYMQTYGSDSISILFSSSKDTIFSLMDQPIKLLFGMFVFLLCGFLFVLLVAVGIWIIQDRDGIFIADFEVDNINPDPDCSDARDNQVFAALTRNLLSSHLHTANHYFNIFGDRADYDDLDFQNHALPIFPEEGQVELDLRDADFSFQEAALPFGKFSVALKRLWSSIEHPNKIDVKCKFIRLNNDSYCLTGYFSNNAISINSRDIQGNSHVQISNADKSQVIDKMCERMAFYILREASPKFYPKKWETFTHLANVCKVLEDSHFQIERYGLRKLNTCDKITDSFCELGDSVNLDNSSVSSESLSEKQDLLTKQQVLEKKLKEKKRVEKERLDKRLELLKLAEDECAKICTHEPQYKYNSRLYYRIGLEYFIMSVCSDNKLLLEDCQRVFKRSFGCDPSWGYAHYGLALVRQKINELNAGKMDTDQLSVENLCKTAIPLFGKKDSEVANVYNLLGSILDFNNIKNQKTAADYFIKSINFKQDLWRPYFNLGLLYLSMKETDFALNDKLIKLKVKYNKTKKIIASLVERGKQNYEHISTLYILESRSVNPFVAPSYTQIGEINRSKAVRSQFVLLVDAYKKLRQQTESMDEKKLRINLLKKMGEMKYVNLATYRDGRATKSDNQYLIAQSKDQFNLAKAINDYRILDKGRGILALSNLATASVDELIARLLALDLYALNAKDDPNAENRVAENDALQVAVNEVKPVIDEIILLWTEITLSTDGSYSFSSQTRKMRCLAEFGLKEFDQPKGVSQTINDKDKSIQGEYLQIAMLKVMLDPNSLSVFRRLYQADYGKDDLKRANLSGANLSGANLREANLSGANLRKADLSEADLSGANLRKANLRKADLSGANLRKADLRWAYLRWADLRWADLRWADLRGANLREADLRWVDLSGAKLSGAKLSEADLSGVNLGGSWYGSKTQWPKGFDWRNCGAIGPDANLSGADLRKADLRKADLSGADLSEAYLSGAGLRWADLRWADLRWADLRSADLRGANLREADLSWADLSSADLSEVLGLTQAQIDAVCSVDKMTRFPEDIVPPRKPHCVPE